MTDDIDYIEFKQVWPTIKRRFLPAVAVFTLVAGGLSFLTFRRGTTYTAEGRLLVQSKSDALSLTGVSEGIGSLEAVVDRGNPLLTEAEIIRSNAVIQETVSRLEGIRPHPLTPQELIEELSIVNVKSADILKLSYESEIPEKSVLVLNTLMDVYLEEHIRLQRNEALTAKNFLENRISELQVDINQLSTALRSFKETNQVPLLANQAESVVALSQTTEKRMSDIRAEIANLETQSQLIQAQLGMEPQQALIMTEISQSPAIQTTLAEIQQIEEQLAAARALYRDNHPTITTLNSKLANLQALLRSRINQVLSGAQGFITGNLQSGELNQSLSGQLINLEAQRLGLASELESLSFTAADYLQRAAALPELEQRQQALEQQLADARSSYQQLLPKLEESQRVANQNPGNVRIISKATPETLTASSRNFYYLLSVLLGLLSAAATVYLLENRDQSVRDVPQIRRLLGIPVLGVIPKIKVGSPADVLVASISPNSPFKATRKSEISMEEAFRVLRVNFKSQCLEKSNQAFVVTSSTAQEGTSTVCAALANALARIGHKVLLLEANLHMPQQAEIWEVSNEKGLSDALNQWIAPEQCIQAVEKNLDLLPAGSSRDLPADLIDSPLMATILTTLKADYDCTIVDAPALELGADAIVLGQLADGVLLTIRPGLATAPRLDAAKAALDGLNAKNLGLVVNASDAPSYGYKII